MTDQTTISPAGLAYLRACEEEVDSGRALENAHDELEAGCGDFDTVMEWSERFTAAKRATDAARAAWDAERGQR